MAQAISGFIGPLGWGTTVGTVSQLVLPQNPSRNSLIFFNGSQGGQNIAICPAVVNPGSLGVYPGFQLGVAVIGGVGCITMAPGDKFIIDSTTSTTAWNGISSAANGILTMLEA